MISWRIQWHTFFNFFTAYLSDNDRWLLYYTVLQVSNVAHLNYFFMVKEKSSTISHLKMQLTWNLIVLALKESDWNSYRFCFYCFFWPRNQSFDFQIQLLLLKLISQWSFFPECSLLLGVCGSLSLCFSNSEELDVTKYLSLFNLFLSSRF